MGIGTKTRLSRLETHGKIAFLAMDQGMEHGPSDFNDKNNDPDYVISIAAKAGFNAMILNKGVALKYFDNYAGKVPLILKLTGKTNVPGTGKEMISAQIASVKDAVELGADAVGYTIYVGVPEEERMMKEFSKIEDEARDYGMPVVTWMYPKNKNPKSVSNVSYATRIGMELGADIIKTYYTGSEATFRKAVMAAQGSRVVCSGGLKKGDAEFLEQVRSVMNAGAAGIAVGRNVWQHKNPVGMSKAIKSIIFKNAQVKDALKFLK